MVQQTKFVNIDSLAIVQGHRDRNEICLSQLDIRVERWCFRTYSTALLLDPKHILAHSHLRTYQGYSFAWIFWIWLLKWRHSYARLK